MNSGDLRDAYFLSLERFDLQSTFQTTGRYLEEQVTIYTADRDRSSSMVLLPERDKELQVSMKARDEAGANLILVPRTRLEDLYAEVFSDALVALEAYPDIPEPLGDLIGAEDFEALFFGGDWFDRVRQDPEARDEVERFLTEIVGGFDEEVSDEEAAIGAFGNYVTKHLDETFRPCVLLDTELGGDADGALVKYTVQGDVGLSAWKKVLEAVLGFIPLDVERGHEPVCSSHLRLNSPEGMVFNHPVIPPDEYTGFYPGRQQLQVYYAQEDGQRLAIEDEGDDGEAVGDEQDERAGRSRAVRMRGRLTQSASTRAIVGSLFALVAVAPVLLSGGAADGVLPLGAVWDALSVPWSAETVRGIGMESVQTTIEMGLPLAILLVATAWDRRPVRPFAVTQLIIALLLTVGWIVGIRVPSIGEAVVKVGLGLPAYHVLEAITFLAPLSKRGWYEWAWNG